MILADTSCSLQSAWPKRTISAKGARMDPARPAALRFCYSRTQRRLFLRGRYGTMRRQLIAFEGALHEHTTEAWAAAARVEAARVYLDDAVRCGELERAARTLGAMRRGESFSTRTRVLRLVAQARLACLVNDGPDAARALDDLERSPLGEPEYVARVALAHAELAFLRGRDAEAHDLACCAAALAPQSFDVAPQAHALAGRAALLRDTTWEPPVSVPATHWSTSLLQATRARFLLRDGNVEGARAAASTTARNAEAHASPAARAFALATLAAIEECRHKRAKAARLRLEAFSAFASSRNAIVARDIFTWPERPERDLGHLAIDGVFADMLWAFKERLFGEYRRPAYLAMRGTNVSALLLPYTMATRPAG